MSAQPDTRPDLWLRAIDSLSPSTIKSLDPAKTGRRDLAQAALKVAEKKRELILKRRWRIKKPSGQGEIILRDVLEKIVGWIRRFRDVGDQVMQYDPGHAALPWAAFRFVLQVAIDDTTVYSEMVDDLEMVARLMARFRELEEVYFTGPVAADDQLSNALVKVYAAILEFLAKAINFFGTSTAVRLLKAPLRSIDENNKDEILAREAEVLKIAALVDAGRLVKIETQVVRLARLSLATHKSVQGQLYLDVLKWLSQVPYSHHHESHRETRVPGTGQWLVQHPEVRSWTSGSSCSMLLIHGIPGCGKTALCSAIVDKYLDDMSQIPNLAPLVYFYCNASESEPERRTSEGVLRSLARQLTVSKTPQHTVHSAVIALYNKYLDDTKEDGFEMRKAKIADCVELILAALEDNPATLVIDGLDEIDQPKPLVDALDTITNRSTNVVKVFITSRDSPAIFVMLASAQKLRITEDCNKADIRSFTIHAVTSAITDHKLLMGNVTQKLKERLVDALVSGAGEMFLWVKLQLLHLCSIEHEQDLITASTRLAAVTLNELYRAGYERIQQAGKISREIAIRTFAWLLYAKEPLTIDSFTSAIVSASQLEQATVQNILAICKDFLYLDKQSMVFRLAHHSVQEFLQLQDTLEPRHAQNLLAISCLSICNDPPDNEIMKIEPRGSVYDYAVLYCGHHCSAAQFYGASSALTQELTLFFFDGAEPSLSARIWMENCKVAYNTLPREHSQKMAMALVSNEQCSPLFPICAFGLSDLLETATWHTDFDWDERNDQGHTALYAASLLGHIKIVTFLLDQGADSNIECGKLGSALHCAAYQGHTEVVKLLLDRGADVTFGAKFDSAVHAACRGDREEVVLTIIDKAEIADQDQYDSALEVLSEAGFARALEKLQTHRLNHTVQPSKTLQIATKVIISGKVANLKYLARTNSLADIVPRGSVALSALHGHEAMTAYLLDQGLDITEFGKLGTPLRCASLSGSSSVCHLLLSGGADVDGNERFGSALHAASMKGQLHIVKLLLDAGAKVDIVGGYYGTPLQAAAYQGHSEVVSMLLQAGANPHHSGFSKDAFHAAAEGGRHDIIQLLMTSGFVLSMPICSSSVSFCYQPANFSIDSRPPRNPLREDSPDGRIDPNDQRSENEDENEEENLIDASNPTPRAVAYVSVEGRNENYPLEAAAALGHLKVVCEILANYDVIGLGGYGMNRAFIAACSNGHQRVAVEILGQIEEDHMPLREALQKAVSHCQVSVVRMLLAYNCAAESQSDRLKATLQSSMTVNERTFDEVLLMVEKELSQPEVREVLLEGLPTAIEAEQTGIVRAILNHCEVADQKKLISILMNACKNGKFTSVKLIDEALPLQALSREEYSKCTRLAVENGCTDVVQYLLQLFGVRGKAQYMRHMILIAAGCGNLDILGLLLANNHVNDPELLQQSLNLAAENGHEKVCAYLLSTGLDPGKIAPTVTWRDVSVDKDSDPFCPRCDGNNNDLPLLAGKRIALNAIESCIYGFKRIESRQDQLYSSMIRQSWPRQGSLENQASTLRLLLENVPDLKDQMWNEAVCVAAKLCPPSLVAVILNNGANASARYGKWSALDLAVQRERLCFPVMQALIQKGADDDVAENELQVMLARAVSFFIAHEGRRYGGPFPKATWLRDVFTTGPGAVVKYLLQRLPKEYISCAQSSVLLQYASAAGLGNFVTLLIDDHAKANEANSYYGPALQAASCFGHAAIIKLLLDAGADPNICQGPHHTALRAAVLAGSLETVNLLLRSGADTELSSKWEFSGHEEDDPTPLQLAVEDKKYEIAIALIAAGADVNVKRKQHQPLLIQACAQGEIPLIYALLDAGADVQTQGHKVLLNHEVSVEQNHGSGMHGAIEAGRVDVIQLLLSTGFRISDDFHDFAPPLVFAVRKGNVDVINALLSASPSGQTELIRQALHEAIQSSNLTVAEMLLCHETNVLDKGSSVGILRTACEKGDIKVIELLLEELYHCGDVQSACTAVLNDPPIGKASVFETILEYVPCTVDFFVEACVRGYEAIIGVGLEQGMLPSAIDSKGRPALHFAAIGGSITAVELLLMSGANPNAQDLTYGTPLRAALEGCTVEPLVIRELPDDILAHASRLTEAFPDFERAHLRRPLSSLSCQQVQHYEKIVQLLLDKGASPNPPKGLFGSILTMAAFTGIRNIFNMLARSGASNVTGGYLHSPLTAAIEGGHTALAKEIFKIALHTGDIDSMGGSALRTACKTTNLPMVKLLLQHSVDCHAENDEGETPLRISLAHINWMKRPCNWFPVAINPSHAQAIVILLLDAKPAAVVSDQDLIAAAEIEDEDPRTEILQKMIPRTKDAYFPEDAFFSLLEHSRYRHSRSPHQNLLHQLLSEKRLQRITTRILVAAVEAAITDLDIVTSLLDYDPTDPITPETLNSVTASNGPYRREIAGLLLQRDDSLMPSESNILALLKPLHRFDHPEERSKMSVLETMFSRNPRIKVTESMLLTVTDLQDLEVLLARTTPEAGLVTPAILTALAYTNIDCKELLQMIFDFDPKIVVPSSVANRFISRGNRHALEQLWKHDPTLLISEDTLVGLVRNVKVTVWENTELAHANFVELLRKHRGQWRFSRKFRDEIDRAFWKESDRVIKDLYYSIPDEGEWGLEDGAMKMYPPPDDEYWYWAYR